VSRMSKDIVGGDEKRSYPGVLRWNFGSRSVAPVMAWRLQRHGSAVGITESVELLSQ
jgi:hypothetical protein